jgi:hypothetical protein
MSAPAGRLTLGSALHPCCSLVGSPSSPTRGSPVRCAHWILNRPSAFQLIRGRRVSLIESATTAVSAGRGGAICFRRCQKARGARPRRDDTSSAGPVKSMGRSCNFTSTCVNFRRPFRRLVCSRAAEVEPIVHRTPSIRIIHRTHLIRRTRHTRLGLPIRPYLPSHAPLGDHAEWT